MKTRALILDFGGVISRTLFETHPHTEAALGLPRGSLAWRGPFQPEKDALWRDMQNGKISERDYWQARTLETAALAGRRWTKMAQFVRAARGAEPARAIRPEAVAAIAAAKRAGVKLAVLSNELDLFYGAKFRRQLPFMKEMNVVADASYSGILKPDERAYRQCVDALGADAADCVFVDDQKKNIKGGLAFGLRCVHFDVTRPLESYNRAMRLLALPPLKGEKNEH